MQSRMAQTEVEHLVKCLSPSARRQLVVHFCFLFFWFQIQLKFKAIDGHITFPERSCQAISNYHKLAANSCAATARKLQQLIVKRYAYAALTP